MLDLDKLDFSKANGTVPVVTQHAITGAVLMIAHADRGALERTIESGEMHYQSRTRGLWHKGATSGDTQRVVSLTSDCDNDAVLARVVPRGPACHVGSMSCFGEEALAADALGVLDSVIAGRAAELEGGSSDEPGTESPSYTRRLLTDRNARLKKIGEEAAELVVACADRDAEGATEEAADLFYHTLVALRDLGVTLGDIRAVLASRSKPVLNAQVDR